MTKSEFIYTIYIKTTPEKLEFMKFDPKARKHVAYKEIKLK